MAHCSPGKPRLNLCVLELQNRRGYRHGIQRHRYRCWPLCSIDCRKDGRLLREGKEVKGREEGFLDP